jgi:hypothetical protein
MPFRLYNFRPTMARLPGVSSLKLLAELAKEEELKLKAEIIMKQLEEAEML